MRKALYENEGIRMLGEVICTAIAAPPTQKSSETAKITEPAIIIRLTKRPRRGNEEPENLSPAKLYDATRSAWFVGEKRKQAQYAFAVAKFRILEVYSISEWRRQSESGRYEFDGIVAVDIRNRYIGKDVRHYFKPGARAPFIYVNIP